MNTLAAPAPLRRDVSTIGLVSLAHGVSHFCQLVVPPLFLWLGPEFGLSNTRLGLMMSVFFVFSCAGQALAGFVVDRFGAPRVLFGGLGLLALAMAGLASSHSYALMLVCMAVAGLGNCVFHPVDFSILNARISAPRLGHAYASHGLSGNLGWALAPVFVVGISHATGSWRVALFSVSALVLSVMVVLWLYREWLQVEMPRAAASPAASDAGSFDFLRLPAVWSCFAFFMVFAFALGGVQSFAPAAAGVIHGVPVALVALCLSIYMGVGAGGLIVGGYLVRDPQRSVRVAALGFGCAAVCSLLIGLGTWPPLLVRWVLRRASPARRVTCWSNRPRHPVPRAVSMAWCIRAWTLA
jgi:MFS transporter, FSR family, fosmidomycin resistance protein